MQSKISVLQVIPQLDVSGASQGCIDVANYLIENNHNCLVMTHSGKRLEDAKKKDIKVIISPVHSKNPITIFLNIFRLLNVIRKDEIDIIVVGVSSVGIDWMVNQISDYFKDNQRIVLLTKGLAVVNNELTTISEKTGLIFTANEIANADSVKSIINIVKQRTISNK